MSYREDGLCVAELLDGEVSSGSLSCHSQSATPFCQTEGKERGEERIARGIRGGGVEAEGPGYRGVPSLALVPPGIPRPVSSPRISSFSSSCCTQPASRSNSLLRSPPLPSDPPLLPPPSLSLSLFLPSSTVSSSSCFLLRPWPFVFFPSSHHLSLSLSLSSFVFVPAMRRLYEFANSRRTWTEDRPNEDNSCIDCQDAANG